ncbi:helix-turn-helix domain-containing protein [Aquisalimonas lutea]|uniref:IclR family transcriptional regulator n=1 Tax=Aquisalimonas lutea TaxID=1327750 RepID=UPI0025B4D371|nr:helix-turn-helix domain-containing protein [Aquisalimonas lutea]MDN3518223.1 helix-turn-helix domain-containing protein [Aquisalimonas lutea]
MATTLQTLDRGLQALEMIGRRSGGVSVADLAEELDVHRAIAYRIVATLQAHGLVSRTGEGTIRLGAGIARLAAGFEPQLREVAMPLLQSLADTSRATAFISVAQGSECVVVHVAEPEIGLLRVGYRVGSRHPLSLGAAGIAILAGRPPQADEPEAVRQARADGYSLTRGQLQEGAVGVASPLADGQRTGGLEACVGVVAMNDLDTEVAIGAVKTTARTIAHRLGMQ